MKKNSKSIRALIAGAAILAVTLTSINTAARANEKPETSTPQTSTEETSGTLPKSSATDADLLHSEQLTVRAMMPEKHPVAAKKKSPIKRWILAGDSRYVQMERSGCKDKNDYYVAKGSMGLKWLKSQEARIKSLETDDSVIVVGFGINDTYQPKKYVEYVNNAHFKSPVYFCTINPVDTDKYHGFTNSRVAACNDIIKKGAKNYKVIDTYSMLAKTGFDTWDGLHYKANTYKKLYRYIKSQIRADMNR